MNFTKSFELLKRAEALIPLQAQTFSKSRSYFPHAYPVYLQRGNGCQVRDVDGNRFVDFILGLGSISLGYKYPAVDNAIIEQLLDGINFSLPHPLELRVAELLHQLIPCAEMIRFSKNGTDVTTAAVKLARYYTGRQKVAYWGYHGGSSDWYSVATDKPAGTLPVRDYILPFRYNDIDSLISLFKQNRNQIAAVIMEPVISQPPKDGFLQQVRQVTEREGAVLVFDEMVTGFRMDLKGAQAYFGVTPDLACFGKSMANGMPLAALVGRSEIMKLLPDVFFSYTFAGECLSLAAAEATITEMRNKAVIPHIWRMGQRLIDGWRALGVASAGYPCRPIPMLEPETVETRSLLMQELVKQGVLCHSSNWNICYAHTPEIIDRALDAFEGALKVVKRAIAENRVKEMLEGEPIRPAFRRQ